MADALPAALTLTGILASVSAFLGQEIVQRTMIAVITMAVSGWMASSMRRNWDRRNRAIKRKAHQAWDRAREKRTKQE